MKSEPIYFDHNATTPIHPEVREAMLPWLTEQFGNPSSLYRLGKSSQEAIVKARAAVAGLIGASPGEVVFTGCGTESNNSTVWSALHSQPTRRHLLFSAVEHSSNYKQAAWLKKQGYEISLAPVESDGTLDLLRVEQMIRPDTALVSLMWANNETGVLFPVDEVAAICRSKNVWFHSDAIQAAGKVPIDVGQTDVDFLSLSAHKLNAPKGVGALYVRKGRPFVPLLIGGSQERGRRGGTENVAAIVAFGKAAEIACNQSKQHLAELRKIRDYLESRILKEVPKASRNGAKEPRLLNTSNIAFAGLEAESLLVLLDTVGICASSGSACTTGSVEPSHVLTAMGVPADRARGCIRFSVGLGSRLEDVDVLMTHLPKFVQQLRS